MEQRNVSDKQIEKFQGAITVMEIKYQNRFTWYVNTARSYAHVEIYLVGYSFILR